MSNYFAREQVFIKGSDGVLRPVDENTPFPMTLKDLAVMLAVDIQGININNPKESLPVRWVDADGNYISFNGGSGTVTETDPVDIIDLLPSTALRDNAAKTVALPDLKKYKRYVIQVLNGCDQDVKVVPWNTAPAVFEDNTTGYFSTTATTDDTYSWVIPKKDANTSGLFYLNILEPKSNGAGTKKVKDYARLFESVYSISGVTMMLAYKAVTAPTAGSLTIRFIGFKR